MVKIRLCADTEEELSDVVNYFEKLLPNMRFTAPRMGTNPKYEADPKWFSYGEPRQKNKKPARTNFKVRLKNLY